jgi:filamentous hemagglutinin
VGFAASLNYGQERINSDYASVTEQSGIRAGDNGFQVDVKGDTTLTGGAITSTQAAIDENKNSFTTGGTLTLSDIENHASYQADSIGLNIGTRVDTLCQYTPQGSGMGIGEDSGKAGSTTLAAISGIAGNTSARTGDPESGIERIFDADTVQKDIAAQVQITQAFGQQASKAVGDYADTKMKEAVTLREQAKDPSLSEAQQADLNAQAQAIEDQWGSEGTLRLAAHILIGGLTGGTDGALGSLAGTLTGPEIARMLEDSGLDPALRQALIAIASTTAGAAVGGTAGAATAFNEVTNNYLSHTERMDYLKALLACKDGNEACQSRDALLEESKRRNEALEKACGLGGNRADCDGELAKLSQVIATYSQSNEQEYRAWIYGNLGALKTAASKDETLLSNLITHTTTFDALWKADCAVLGGCPLSADQLMRLQGDDSKDVLDALARHVIMEQAIRRSGIAAGAGGRVVDMASGLVELSESSNPLMKALDTLKTISYISENGLGTYLQNEWQKYEQLGSSLWKAGGDYLAEIKDAAHGSEWDIVNVYLHGNTEGKLTFDFLTTAQGAEALLSSKLGVKAVNWVKGGVTGGAGAVDEALASLNSPATRHYADKVTQSSVAKEVNTVVDRSVVDISADVAAIRAGQAQQIGDTFVVNGRTYGMHDGTLYPMSGPGLYTLDRGGYKALGVLNKFGDTPQADMILKNMGVSAETKAAALEVFKAISK